MEYITIADSLVITVFSMAVVFLVLLGISYMIDFLRMFAEKRIEKNATGKNLEEIKVVEAEREDEDIREIDDEELVAVISAALAASMGAEIPEIRIKSIRRRDESWKTVARQEQVLKNI